MGRDIVALDAETLNQLLGTVRRFARERLIPAEASVAQSDEIPTALVDEMRALGLFGLTIAPDYGGLGLTAWEEMQVAMELCYASPVFRSVVGTNIGIGSRAISLDGTPEQRRNYLPKLASGEIIGAFALTEPDFGSDAASIRTKAARDGDFYVLNGAKRFITNAPEASLFTVMARTDPQSTGVGGVSAFLVEADTPGLFLGPVDRKMGQQGAHTCDVLFDDCRVPAQNIIGGREGRGFATAMKTLDRGRLHIAAVCAGFAARVLDEALSYGLERKQFGRQIADFQLVEAMLADSRAELYASRAMVLDAAKKCDGGENITLEASCCKMFASEALGRIADRAVQIHGGLGYMRECAVERFYRDARLFRIYEGTTQIQQIIIAREMKRRAGG